MIFLHRHLVTLSVLATLVLGTALASNQPGLIWTAIGTSLNTETVKPTQRKGSRLGSLDTSPVKLVREKSGSRLPTATPRALAEADVNEDGIADVIAAYSEQETGTIQVYSDFEDSLQNLASTPKAIRDIDAPRDTAPNNTIAAPAGIDFLGAGDFDNDGHIDLVTAARGATRLFFMLGDGHGEFARTKSVEVPGGITALRAGEVNRPDGIQDLAVAVTTSTGSELLVFDSPNGVLGATPDVFAMPSAVHALAIGALGGSGARDIAVGAGAQLIVIHGRDRKLSFGVDRQLEVKPAVIESREFSSDICGVAVREVSGAEPQLVVLLNNTELVTITRPISSARANRNGDYQSRLDEDSIKSWTAQLLAPGSGSDQLPSEPILITARTSTEAYDQVVVSHGSQINIHGRGPRNTSSADPENDSFTPFVKSLQLDDEIADVLPMHLNKDALSDLVILDSKGLSVVASQPDSVFSVTNTNDAGAGSLRAAILSANTSAGLDTISFNIPGGGVHTISPTSPLPQITDPVTIDATTQPGFTGTPLIELDGSQAGETNGLFLAAGDCTIRGLAINRFFEFGQNPYAGFQIWIDITSGHNRIEGNFINTNAQGTDAAPNPQDLFRSGIFVQNSADNVIGGTSPSARNIISGNKQYGIYLNGTGTTRTIIQGNYIGVDITGTKAVKNGFLGIYIFGTENLIGGVVPGARNIIANNAPYGIRLDGDALDSNRIQGNYIGTDATGTVAMPNSLSGIFLGQVRYTTVGGTSPLARNVISGHSQYGIDINASGTDGFVVQGNYIGTDVTGTTAIPNRTAGINLGNTKDSLFSNNLISGNTGYGIHLYGIGIGATAGTEIRNNLIGTDYTGATPLGNSEVGVYVDGTGGQTIVANTIAFNRKGGVYVGLAWNDPIRQNSIFSNGGLGIDLAKSGCSYLLGCYGTVVANDACDADSGGNLLQNYPVISGAFATGSGTVIAGTLNSTANTRFIIDVFSNSSCNASGYGEGKVFVGSYTVTTDSSCNASFGFLVPAVLSNGDIVTATATDPNGNTSEFSQCIAVGGSISPPSPSPTPSPTPAGTAAVFQFLHSSESIEEGAGAIIVTVVRTGSLAGIAYVDYATVDGTATQRKDYIPAIGSLRFDDGESRKSFVVLIVDDAYRSAGGGKSLNLVLSNPRGTLDSAVLGAPATITLAIFDNDSGPKPNPINAEWFFVQQQYFDFLNRQPDDEGLAFWITQLSSCNGDVTCTEVKRVNVSAAFFLSIEFQQTGYFVERMYKVAYGDANGTSTLGGSHQVAVPVVRFNEFLQDTQRIGRGVVVLQPGWEQALEINKQAYAGEFVTTSRFAGAFPTSQTPTEFVDKLNQKAGNVLSPSDRTTAINLFNGAADTSNTTARAQAVRQVAEDPDLYSAESNRAFVLTQYFGYLRRNPNDPQDADYTGYEFWLNKLNQFKGDYIGAEMVKAFISSSEYRQRFGP